jgi:hypothetical protein
MKSKLMLGVSIALLLLTASAVAIDKLPPDLKPQAATGSVEAAKTIDASALPQRIVPSGTASGRVGGGWGADRVGGGRYLGVK